MPIELVAFSWRQPTPLSLCALPEPPLAPIKRPSAFHVAYYGILRHPSAVIGSRKNIGVCRVRRAQKKVRPRQSLQSHPRKSVVSNLACRGISKDTKYIVSDGYAPLSSERTMGLFLRRAWLWALRRRRPLVAASW